MLNVPIQLADGTISPARVHEGNPTSPVFVVWPELSQAAEDYDPLAAALVTHGYNVVIGELRGQGASEPKPGTSSDYGYHHLATQDYPAVFELAREQFPESTPYLLGHGLGGQVGMLYAARNPHTLGGLVLVATGSPYFRAGSTTTVFAPFVGAHAVDMTARLVGYWPGGRVGSTGVVAQSKVLVADWTRLARSGRFNPTGADIDYEAAIAELELPVLSVSIARDTYATGTAIRELVGKMQNALVSQWREPRPLGHIGWTQEPTGIVDRLDKWVRDR